jgi:hypothetical protein
MHDHTPERSPAVTRRRFLSGGLAAAAAGLTIGSERLAWSLVAPRGGTADPGAASILATTLWDGRVIALVSTSAGRALHRVEVAAAGRVALGDLLVTSLPTTFDAWSLTADDDGLYVVGASEVSAGPASTCTDLGAVEGGHLDAWGLTTLDQLVERRRWSASIARISRDLRAELLEVDAPSTGDHSWLLDATGPRAAVGLLGTGGPLTREAPYADAVHLVERDGEGAAWRQTPLAADLGEDAGGAVVTPAGGQRPVSVISGRQGTTSVFRGATIVERGLPGTVVGAPVAVADGQTMVTTTVADGAASRARVWSVDGGRVTELTARRRQRIDPDIEVLVGPGPRSGELLVRHRDGTYAVRDAA